MPNKQQQKLAIPLKTGFATLEILLAMFILLLSLTAVITVSFGSQSMVIDSRASSEALNIAQELLKKAQADANQDLNLVNPYSAKSPDNFYDENVTVTHLFENGKPNYFAKLVTVAVSWNGEFNHQQKIALSALVTNFDNVLRGDTCSSLLGDIDSATGNLNYNPEAWKNPEIKNQYSACGLAGISDNYCSITDIDAYNGKLYVALGKTSSNSTPALLIYNIDYQNRQLSFDKAIDNSHNNAIVAVPDRKTQKMYAYAANASVVNPLQIINLDEMKVEDIPALKISAKAQGNSIFYKNGYIYLGLKETPKNKVSIIDVHNPSSAFETGSWPADANSTSTINSIYAAGNYAYITDTQSKKPIILDISNPAHPQEIAKTIDYSDSSANNGKSAVVAGNTLYFGRVWEVGPSGKTFYVLDAANPAAADWPILGYDSGSNQKSVDGIIVRGKTNGNNSAAYPALAFVLTPRYLKIFDVTNNNSISTWGNLFFYGTNGASDVAGSSIYEPVFDCEGNTFFIGSNDDNHKGYISIIAPH